MAGELILLIEDNPTNRKLIRDVLQFQGYTLREADNAEEGIHLARALRPRLILMDLHLPGMDGIAALKQLRADAVSAITGIACVVESARSCFRAVIPSMPGRCRSMRMSRGQSARARWIPSSAVSASRRV